jgi:hypothetical protein
MHNVFSPGTARKLGCEALGDVAASKKLDDDPAQSQLLI